MTDEAQTPAESETSAQTETELLPQEVDEGTTPEDATDEDLAAALAELHAEEKKNGKQTEAQKDTGDTAKKEKAKEAPPANAELEALKAQIATLESRVKAKEQFIQRQANEVGELRKRARDLEEHSGKLKEALKENWGGDPETVRKLQKAIDKNEAELESVQAAEQQANFAGRNEAIIKAVVNAGKLAEEDLNYDDMAATLKEDGVAAPIVENFRANPYTVGADVTYQLAKRVKAENLLRKLVPIFKKVVDENTSLKGKPSRVLDSVQKALKATPKLTAAKQDATSDEDDGAVDVPMHELSDAELNALLQKRTKRK